MKFLTTLLLSLVISTNVSAASQQILEVGSDQDNDVTILTAENEADGKFIKLTKSIRKNGTLTGSESFTLSQLRSGVTMVKQEGRNIVRLKASSSFDAYYGGTLEMDYLVNGITGSRDSIDLDATKNGTQWELHMNGRKVKKMKVISNKIFGQVVGIDSIKIVN